MNVEAEARAAAERFRREHHLGVQPIGDLVALIEQAAGIDVAVLDASPDEHGLTMQDPERDVTIIGVARTQKPMRQRSSLAHELGHVLFEDWSDTRADLWAGRTPAEIRADAFARHLLIPVDGVRDFVGVRDVVRQSVLSDVVQRFLVSPAIAAIALHRSGYIDADTKQEWINLASPQLAARFGWSDQYRALQADSDRRRAPQRLLARAIAGYAEGVLPAQAIATLRGVPVDEIKNELRDAGIAPPEQPIAWAKASDLPAADVDLAHLTGTFRNACQLGWRERPLRDMPWQR